MAQPKYLDEAGLQYYTGLIQGMPDGETIVYGQKDGAGDKKLYVPGEAFVNGIPDRSISSQKLANKSVITDKIEDYAVGISKINPDFLVYIEKFDWSTATKEQIAAFLTSSSEEIVLSTIENGADKITAEQVVTLLDDPRSNVVSAIKDAGFSKVPYSEISKYPSLGIAEEFKNSTRKITVSGYGQKTLYVLGIQHDDLADGSGKASFTLYIGGNNYVGAVEQKMNSDYITTGGWKDCSGRTFLNSTFKQALPSDLKQSIAPVKKYYKKTVSDPATTINDSVFLLSETEYLGTETYGKEGTQYQFLKDGTLKFKPVSNDSIEYIWLRSVVDDRSFAVIQHYYNSGEQVLSSKLASQSCTMCPCIALR